MQKVLRALLDVSNEPLLLFVKGSGALFSQQVCEADDSIETCAELMAEVNQGLDSRFVRIAITPSGTNIFNPYVITVVCLKITRGSTGFCFL
jgi:hypothetical protein